MKLSGVMPALVTPFDANNKVDFKALEKHMLNLRAAGVTGWVPLGSTGEYFSMSNEEREEVLRFVKDFANDIRHANQHSTSAACSQVRAR